MSCILNAVDSDGVQYLLLDCTQGELFKISLILKLNISLSVLNDVFELKQKLDILKIRKLDTLKGMMKRNMIQLTGLLEMDFPVTLDYEFDSSEPTSDYRYPVIKVKKYEDDEEWIEVKCEKPEEYDKFMEWKLPKFIENANLFFGSEGQYDYFIGKTQTGTYAYNKCRFTGSLSDDLFFELQD